MLAQCVDDYEKSTSLYFNDISKYKSLSKDEELEIINHYKETGSDKDREKILNSNLKFVANVAKAYKGRGISYSDLIAEGNMGMMRALDNFDTSRGVKFISYAVWWIRQAIEEAITKRNNLPAEDLPTDYERLDNESVDAEDVDYSLDKHYIDNETYLTSENELDVRKILSTVSCDLSDKEKDILSQYYGLNGEKEKTLEEIGALYHLTKERIRQINKKSLIKMRDAALRSNIIKDIYR